nr:MAG TPA: hypothetical protein [Caudoviricetes sp.]
MGKSGHSPLTRGFAKMSTFYSSKTPSQTVDTHLDTKVGTQNT